MHEGCGNQLGASNMSIPGVNGAWVVGNDGGHGGMALVGGPYGARDEGRGANWGWRREMEGGLLAGI